MKIAASIFKFFPYGGVQLDFLRIIEECHRRGHEIEVFTTKWEGECPGYVTLHLLGVKSVCNHRRMAEFGRECRRLATDGEFDLIFGANRIPGLDVYFAGDNCYAARGYSEHGFFYRLMPRYRTYCRLEKSVFERGGSCRIMLIAPSQRPDFEKFYHTEAERFYLLPPGIPEDRRRPDNASSVRAAKRAELGVDENRIMLLQVGSGFATKGVERSIRAFASLASAWRNAACLFVVGRDDPRKYQRLARRLKVADKVIFLGGRGDVNELLLAADLMVHPAVNDAAASVLAEAIFEEGLKNVTAGASAPEWDIAAVIARLREWGGAGQEK